jgi:hypothetical protein
MKYFAVLALLILTRPLLSAVEPVELKQRWLPGKKYYQTLRTHQTSKVALGDEKLDQSTSVTLDLSLTVDRQKAGEPKRMTIRYERAAVELNINDQKLGYDSANPGANTDPLGLSKTIGATVGKELKLVLDDKDQVTNIENYDDFIKSLPPSQVPGMDPAKMYSRSALTEMLQQGGLYSMPGKPVSPGDTWPFNLQLELPGLGKVSVNGNYTFKGMTDHNGTICAEIVASGTLTLVLADVAAKGDSELAALGAAVTGGTVKGSVWFDPQLGCARDTQLVHELTMTMQDPSDPSVKITIPTTQRINATISKVEDVK